MKLAAVKRQRFPARASRQVRGLFILGLGSSPTTKELLHGLFYETSRDGLVKNVRPLHRCLLKRVIFHVLDFKQS